jgi:hypothetical protein
VTSGVIGYYVHHVGAGHLNRARAVAARSAATVTGLSSLPAPVDWPGPWLTLDRDDRGADPVDPTAGGGLHWAPEHDEGLRRRMASLSAWIDRARPDAVVADVSVEVALLARLHGVPVVSVVLPGLRGDRPHRAAHAASSGLVAAWPERAVGMVSGLTPADRRRLHHVGGLSRLPVGSSRPSTNRRPSVLVLSGRGGGHPTLEQVRAAQAQTCGWSWRTLGGAGEWLDDPAAALAEADVVVTQAGECAIADVAAARRPTVVVPAARPFGEQEATARALLRGPWPCRVVGTFPATGWSTLLDEVAALDGGRWGSWCDGRAADRFADYLDAFADRRRRRIA